MVKIEWGAKRTCLNCGARFYDLQKSSATCPKCGTVYEVQAPVRGRRGKANIVDLSKDLLLDNVATDLDLGVEIGAGIPGDLIEDTDELSEGLDDIPDIMSGSGDE